MTQRAWMGKAAVVRSADFLRVQALPTRPEYPEGFVEKLSAALRLPGSAETLLDAQARALWDIGTHGHGFCPIKVGGGKCLGRGTPVLMFDGTVKPVEEIVVGDLLMGPDSGPRRVESTCTGTEAMYRILPVKGDPYVVNASHILSMKQTPIGGGGAPCQVGGRIRNLSVTEFLAESTWFRSNWKGWRTGVDFPSSPVVEPYFLGLWLGDGSTNQPDVTSADLEVVEELDAVARRWELDVRVSQRPENASRTYHFNVGRFGGWGRNPLKNWLKDIGVLGDKRVPQAYKVNTRFVRLEVLAGLLDSDGSLGHGYDYSSKIERLADDVCFLARSLGLAAYKTVCEKGCQTGAIGTYYRVSISGDIEQVPCRIPRKRAAPRQQKKSVLVTGLTAEPLGVGEYFGFELSGADRLFLLGDFTVTHNTLLSFLAPRVVGAQRPLLILPASLIQKTEREFHHYAKDWKIAKHLQWKSYEKLGRVSGANELDLLQPDMIIADEAHRLKNPRAAVTRRVMRYMRTHPKTVFVPMSGTIMKSSIKDFAHLLEWSHGQSAPVPLYAETLYEWAQALDEGVNPMERRDPGVLLDLFPGAYDDNGECGDDNNKRARRVFFLRMQATPGVVSADSKDDYTGSLQISGVEYGANAATEENFKKLRTEMVRPDGWALSEAVQVWAVARQLALGLHYYWDPGPPQEWLDARKAWACFVRETLAKPRTMAMGIDSEFQVMNAVLDDKLVDEYGVLAEWRRLRPTFDIHSFPEWHDHTALALCCEWMADHRGIVWVEHRHFAEALSKMSGVAYFGAKGLDAKGNFIQDATGPVIASIAANSAGRNLQEKWSENLVTAPPSDSERWEQLMGRTHRLGQKADSVSVEVLVGCREHLESIPRALSSSEVKADLLGFRQKLKIADLTWPLTQGRRGFRWA